MAPEVLAHRITTAVIKAVLDCKNNISPEEIVLRRTDEQVGQNALVQLNNRISKAITELAEDGKIPLGS